MLKPEQKERLLKLGKEQYEIAEKWDREKEERDPLFQEMIEISGQPEKFERFQELLKQLSETPTHCEHERSIWSSCAGCEEIEQALNPEFYDENGDRLDDEVIEALIEANPEQYGLPPKNKWYS